MITQKLINILNYLRHSPVSWVWCFIFRFIIFLLFYSKSLVAKTHFCKICTSTLFGELIFVQELTDSIHFYHHSSSFFAFEVKFFSNGTTVFSHTSYEFNTKMSSFCIVNWSFIFDLSR